MSTRTQHCQQQTSNFATGNANINVIVIGCKHCICYISLLPDTKVEVVQINTIASALRYAYDVTINLYLSTAFAYRSRGVACRRSRRRRRRRRRRRSRRG